MLRTVFSGLTMTVTALKCEASKYDSKSISIIVEDRYRVYVNGSLADKFVQRFNVSSFKFQYFDRNRWRTVMNFMM